MSTTDVEICSTATVFGAKPIREVTAAEREGCRHNEAAIA